MKKLILIKPIDHIQLGHLYEHIFCDHLVELLREKGLFAYVDYSLDGRTYYDGFIRIELYLYTDKAVKHLDDIFSISITFDGDVIGAGLIQIMAEKYADVLSYDKAKMLEKLEKYHSDSWLDINKESFANRDKPPLTRSGLQLTDRDKRHFRFLKQTISVDFATVDMPKEVALPLFAIISKALNSNLQEDIVRSSFCYTYDDIFRTDKHSARETNRFKIDVRQAKAITNETEVVSTLVHSILQNGFVDRLSQFLQNATTDFPLLAPDDDEVFNKTDLLLGVSDWHRIGTKNNILAVLHAISVEFTLGKSKDSIQLDSIMRNEAN